MTSDIITTTCIAFALWKSRTGWKATDKLIVKLLMFVSYHTCIPMAHVQLCSLVAETQLPPSVLYIRPLLLRNVADLHSTGL